MISEISSVINGDLEYYIASGSKTIDSNCIISGSFAPLHIGHLNLAHWANCNRYSTIFELSIFNCDKQAISLKEILKRIDQFKRICRDVIVSRCANFSHKSTLYKDCRFLVGADTISRVGDPKYYFNDSTEMKRNIKIIRDNGCGFIVFERNNVKLDDLQLIDELKIICTQADNFTPIKISSTDIRNEAKHAE